MRKERKTTHHSKRRIITIVIIVLFAGAVILFVLEKTNTTSFFSSTDNSDASDAQTTSDLPSAQSDFNGGSAAEENKDPGNTLNENRGTAVIEETGSQIVENSDPISSETGEITVYSPTKNSRVTSGAIISGTSSLSEVEYRIIDSTSGVIATGSLTVKNGKFSGKINFNNNATEGRIDLFATRPDFREYSNIEIPVRFRN